MQKYELFFSDKFQQNLNEILTFIAKNSPQNALKFRLELQERIEGALNMPYRYRQSVHSRARNIRDMVFKGFVVVFAVEETPPRVRILGIYKNNLWKM